MATEPVCSIRDCPGYGTAHPPITARSVAAHTLVEQIAKQALDGISQTLTLPEVGLMERAPDGSVYFEVYTPDHGTFRVMVTAT